MADIQSEILKRYKIDIAQENIFKLYKIDSADISPQDLESKIQETRKKWTASINGANEKNAERDRARLEKADKYEAILRDNKLRKAVFDFNNKTNGSNSGSTAPGGGSTDFAREYFELVKTTKKIKQADVNFFFDYYQSERKNKKAILEMLSKEMKIIGLGKEGKYADETDTSDEDGKKKDDASPVIVNLFQEATVLNIRNAVEKLKKASQSDEVCRRYPALKNSFYEFLEIDDVKDAKQFTECMSAKSKEVYAIRQERGQEYVPLVDMFNTLKAIGDYQDVVDNFPEFKLLLKYPDLTPYMFAFVDMKPATVDGIVKVANKYYSFRDDTDFILNYYKPVHDHFGISDGGIGSILRKAEKKAKQNKVLNAVDKKLGRNKNKRKISVGAEIIHWLVYWPIFAVYLVFEVAKAIFTKLRKLAIPVFVILFGLENWLLPKLGILPYNLLILRKVFFKKQWISCLEDFMGTVADETIDIIASSFAVIWVLLAVYILPPLFVSMFVKAFADDFNKRFDWIGIERTFKQIFEYLRQKTENQYSTQKKFFIKNKVPKIIINLVSLAMLVGIIIFAPAGFRKFSETTGYFQKEEDYQEAYNDHSRDDGLDSDDYSSDDGLDGEYHSEESLPVGDTMVITAGSANIRSGPSTDYEIVANASKGTTFVATGQQETASNGGIWYEIYLDDEMTQTGWASQKVIDFQ